MTRSALRAVSGDVQTLLEMLTYCRPAYSKTVEIFCNRYLDVIPGMQVDAVGNRFLRIGTAPVLWSCHTDTVHNKEGSQKVIYGAGVVSLDSHSKSSCLGADDTAGVWLMVQMIKYRVPGLYIFHAAEEVGGIGSEHIARNTPELLAGITHAVALDRKGTGSVITHQCGRTCSDAFASALAGDLGGNFAKDDSGLFTDTANYTRLVPECTNLSVGYYNAHSPNEYLDVSFLVSLLAKLCVLDFFEMPVIRSTQDKEDFMDAWRNDDWRQDYKDQGGDLFMLVVSNPDIATDILEDMGIDLDTFYRYMEAAGR